MTLAIRIYNETKVPIYAQIAQQIKSMIASEALKVGSSLPRRQPLAYQLGVNINTINHAYRILETEGYIVSRRGGGSFVKEKPHYKSADGLVGEIYAQLDEVRRLALTLGLSGSEFGDVLGKWLSRLRSGAAERKIQAVFVECHQAWTDEIALDLQKTLGIEVQPIVIGDRERKMKEVVDSLKRFDIIITTHAHWNEVKALVDTKHLIFPLDLHLSHELLRELSNMKESEIAVPFVDPSTVKRLSLLLAAQGFLVTLIAIPWRNNRTIAKNISKYKTVLVPKTHLKSITDIAPKGTTILTIKPAVGQESIRHLKETISKLQFTSESNQFPITTKPVSLRANG
jgi:GntR family transcriptional regulator